MSAETTSNLERTTLDALQDLIQINIDSARGFEEAARRVELESLKNLFAEIGRERETQAVELQQHVERSGERACDEGTIAAAFQRIWLDFRGRLAGGDPLVILSEAEKGEDQIKAAYEDVLVRNAGSAIQDVLTRQYLSVKVAHNKIRDLRDGYK